MVYCIARSYLLTLFLPALESELKRSPDTLTYEQARDILQCPLTDHVTPGHAHSLCMWGEEELYGHVEVEFGQKVRLKTRGDSCLIGT